jgi:hypothetical protein
VPWINTAHNRSHLAAMSNSDATFNPRSVPQELVDLIIDHLRADEDALKRCSLVTTAWVTRSRSHLFYKVEIRDDAQLDAWASLFPYPGASVAADFVRRLHVDQPRLLEDTSKFSLEQFHNLDLFSLGSCLLSKSIHTELHPPAMHNILLLPNSLRGFHLVLEHIYSWHISSLCQRFPDLDDLSVRGHTFQHRHPNGSISSPKFRGELLVSLGRDSTVLLDLLATLQNGVRFSHMNLSLPGDTPWKISTWLLSVVDTLTSLHIDTTSRGECCET